MNSPSDEVVSNALLWLLLHIGFIFLLFASLHNDEVKVRAFIISAAILFSVHAIATHESTWNFLVTVMWNMMIVLIQSIRIFSLLVTRRRNDRTVFKDDLLFAAERLSCETFDQYTWS
jgi:hypothetical protein